MSNQTRKLSRWTPKRIDELRTRVARGEQHKTIALALGVSIKSIRCKASELGIKSPVATHNGFRAWDEAEVIRLRQLIAEGRSATSVAAQLGVTLKAVRKTLAEQGIKYTLRPRGFSSPLLQERAKEAHTLHNRAEWGYLPKSQHPDWTGVNFR